MFFFKCRPARHMWTMSEATEHGGDQRQDAFPERLVRRPGEEDAGADAEGNRREDAPVDGGDQALVGRSS